MPLVTLVLLVYIKSYFKAKNSFVVEVSFKTMLAFKFHFIFYFYLLNLAATSVVSVKAHKLYKSLMFI